MRIIDAYEMISDKIDRWAAKNFYDSFVVIIMLNGQKRNELLLLDSDIKFYWENDWWEGEENVELIGFIPITMITQYIPFCEDETTTC